MTAKLWMLCHAATAATRSMAFPADEAIEAGTDARIGALAARLPRFDRVLTSPALRARETAAALGTMAGLEEVLRDADFGRWRGRALSDVFAEEPDAAAAWLTDPHFAPPEGEAIVAVIARIGAWLESTPFSGRTLAVTHPAVIRASLVHVLRAPADSFWAIDVVPLSVVQLAHDGRRWRLRCTPP